MEGDYRCLARWGDVGNAATIICMQAGDEMRPGACSIKLVSSVPIYAHLAVNYVILPNFCGKFWSKCGHIYGFIIFGSMNPML